MDKFLKGLKNVKQLNDLISQTEDDINNQPSSYRIDRTVYEREAKVRHDDAVAQVRSIRQQAQAEAEARRQRYHK